MRNDMEILDIIRRIVARKRAARQEQVFALWREIWQEYVADGGTEGIDEQLAALEEKGAIVSHRTVTDMSFEPIEDEEEQPEEQPNDDC